jgi:hypothetical protein
MIGVILIMVFVPMLIQENAEKSLLATNNAQDADC